MKTIRFFSRRLPNAKHENLAETGGDPLSHPDIAAMNPRELADLPLPNFTNRPS